LIHEKMSSKVASLFHLMSIVRESVEVVDGHPNILLHQSLAITIDFAAEFEKSLVNTV